MLDAQWLRGLARECGADDCGLVEAERPALGEECAQVQRFLPGARTLLALVCRTNREPIRNPARSASNVEFHAVTDELNRVARRIVRELEALGVRAANPAAGFPMEMDAYPGRIWCIAHKPVALEAGLGRMGIHRNLIHPRFGSFVLLDTVVIEAAASAYDRPVEFNPCFECKLCVAACPVGAIGADGHFDFAACATHNYREFMGGFRGWVEELADSADAHDYARRVSDSETSSLWQSLSFGPNYKAAYCIAVCPAGEDVIGPYQADKREHLERVVRPLQHKEEPVYVVAGSDAEEHVQRRFPRKRVRRVRQPLRPTTIHGFVAGLKLVFQRGQSQGLDATYHFRFEGEARLEATVRIADQRIEVRDGLHGEADLTLEADAATWLACLRGERSFVGAVLLRRLRVRGPLRLLRAFQRCFPG